MSKCVGHCKYLESHWVRAWECYFECTAQKNKPRVDPWIDDCPYNILVNETNKYSEDYEL